MQGVALKPEPVIVHQYNSVCSKCGTGFIRIEFPFIFCPYDRTPMKPKVIGQWKKNWNGEYSR